MRHIENIAHIKHIWPTVREISEDLGVPYTTAHSWAVRGRIPADYDLNLIRAAKKRGEKLTLEYLATARMQSAAPFVATHNALPVNATPRRQGVSGNG